MQWSYGSLEIALFMTKKSEIFVRYAEFQFFAWIMDIIKLKIGSISLIGKKFHIASQSQKNTFFSVSVERSFEHFVD
jgi:hypothetical protein